MKVIIKQCGDVFLACAYYPLVKVNVVTKIYQLLPPMNQKFWISKALLLRLQGLQYNTKRVLAKKALKLWCGNGW